MPPLWRYARNVLVLYVVIFVISYVVVRFAAGDDYSSGAFSWYFVVGSGAYAVATGCVYSVIHTAVLEVVRTRHTGWRLIAVSVGLGTGLAFVGALLHGVVGGNRWLAVGLTFVLFMGFASAIIGAITNRSSR